MKSRNQHAIHLQRKLKRHEQICWGANLNKIPSDDRRKCQKSSSLKLMLTMRSVYDGLLSFWHFLRIPYHVWGGWWVKLNMPWVLHLPIDCERQQQYGGGNTILCYLSVVSRSLHGSFHLHPCVSSCPFIISGHANHLLNCIACGSKQRSGETSVRLMSKQLFETF